MNIFVLSTGRCGSLTFVKACEHITNYTTAHESRSRFLGEERVSFPANHIESDNRLSWFLGSLDRLYGKQAFYVHLIRDESRTARSFMNRYDKGIIKAYRKHIIRGSLRSMSRHDLCLDYCRTVNANIEMFLRDKPLQMRFRLEHAQSDFREFWETIEAEGDLRSALEEWNTAYNASGESSRPRRFAVALESLSKHWQLRRPTFINSRNS